MTRLLVFRFDLGLEDKSGSNTNGDWQCLTNYLFTTCILLNVSVFVIRPLLYPFTSDPELGNCDVMAFLITMRTCGPKLIEYFTTILAPCSKPFPMFIKCVHI